MDRVTFSASEIESAYAAVHTAVQGYAEQRQPGTTFADHFTEDAVYASTPSASSTAATRSGTGRCGP